MQAHIHQTKHEIADFTSISNFLKAQVLQQTKGIHLFPELFLTGYPLNDLILSRQFLTKYEEMFKDLDSFFKSKKKCKDEVYLFGGIKYLYTESNKEIDQIQNVVFAAIPGIGIESIYQKRLLPNYDIFSEKKYFTAGNSTSVFKFQEFNILILICEDMWPSNIHQENPILDDFNFIKEEKITLDLIVNFSGSPYYLGKNERRVTQGQKIAKIFNTPFAYINRVGAEAELLFDGGSFVTNSENIMTEACFFKEDSISFNLCKNKIISESNSLPKELKIIKENLWQGLFATRHENNLKPIKLRPLTDPECEEILKAIEFGVQEYAQKTSFKSFLVALSGGLDSSLVLTLAKIFLKKDQHLEAIFMPSIHTSAQSYDLSYQLAKNLQIKLTTMPIKFFHSAVKNAYRDNFREELKEIADENFQSRIRGTLLYLRSNDINAMVLNTSNKSELSVGYSTLYGDSVGAISVLGDLYKTQVISLAKYVNKKFNNIIPEQIITRPPTAELKSNQTDESSLLAYEKLDAILEGILSYQMTKDELIASGFTKEEVEKIWRLYHLSEFKRVQFCPIIKLVSKSLGFGYDIPILKYPLYKDK